MTLLEMETYCFEFLQSNPSGAGVGDWTKAEIDRYLHAAHLKMFTIVADKHEHFFSTSQNLTETAATATIDLPTNCYKGIMLERLVGLGASPTAPVPMNKLDRNVNQLQLARSRQFFPFSGTVDFPMDYFFHGQKIVELIPSPAATTANALKLTYVFRPAAMSGATDVPFQIAAGTGGTGKDNLEEFHEIIPLRALELALTKEESFAQADRIKDSRQERESELQSFLSKINTQAPRYVDVTPETWDD